MKFLLLPLLDTQTCQQGHKHTTSICTIIRRAWQKKAAWQRALNDLIAALMAAEKTSAYVMPAGTWLLLCLLFACKCKAHTKCGRKY
eukprot:scaffold86303_cov22-Tisochrysis_lutea.AAC.3